MRSLLILLPTHAKKKKKKKKNSTVNAVLEAARDIRSPIMVQFSNGGADFFAGKGLDNSSQQASILGSIAGAHVRTIYN